MDLREQLQLSLGSGHTIERELGGGGMSQVFLAEERALGRKIVVKVLPSDSPAAVSVERFRREIQVAARLQHPHIVPLLSAGEANGIPYYTMPYVQGDSLRARLSRGGEMSVNEALHVLHDVAAALAYAHGEGVVHRDIKPENVILSGRVAVVTDFGVAKAMDVAATDAGADSSGLTSIGVALGTPAYMSPEQASADPHVDERADIYSFGCLAYELLTGAGPFAGRSPQQMLVAHVTEAPEPLARRRPSAPSALAALIMKCLEKRPGDRPQSADELLAALDSIATPSGGMSPTDARLRAVSRGQMRWLAAAVVVLLLGGGAWVAMRARTPPPYSVGTTTGIAMTPAIELSPAISPDGRFVAYAAQVGADDGGLISLVGGQTATTTRNGRIFVRQVDGGRPLMVSGELPGNHDHPAWSPDGSRVAFIANDGVYVVSALGGTPRRLIDGSSRLVVTPAWSPDGTSIAHADVDGVWIRPVDGAATARLIVRGLAHSPAFSPDGRRLAYVRGNKQVIGNTSTTAVWVTSIEEGAIPVRVSDAVHVNSSPQWTPDGRALLFLSSMGGGNLDVFQQAIADDGEAQGAPVRLTTGLSALHFSLSADGTRAAYDVVRVQSNVWTSTARSGAPASFANARQVTRDNQIVEGVALSPDGEWLAFDSNRRGNFDIYKVRVGGGEAIQLTDHPANDFIPGWSPDGREIAFHSTRQGTRDIYVVGADGGAERPVVATPAEELQARWSPDGRRIAFTYQDTQAVHGIATRANDTWTVSGPFVVSATRPSSVPQTNWSPDGRLMTRVVDGEVFVFAPDGSGKRAVGELRARGYYAMLSMWATDPATLYVHATTQDGGSVFLTVPLAGGAPRVLVSGEGRAAYRAEFATDGRRFFFMLPRIESDVSLMHLRR